MMNKTAITAGVVGASGYAGHELLRLLERHPRFNVVFATSEAEAGARAPFTGTAYVRAADAPLSAVDIVFSCLPTGESGKWALESVNQGARAIDLSGDLRGGESGAAYGLPELWRDAIPGAALVANPGCYPTGTLLALAPALRHGRVERSRTGVIDAASGGTGAGRSARRDLLFGEVAEEYRAYGAGNQHRHVPEIAAGMARAEGGRAPEFVFTPHLLPVRRGILETIYLPLLEPMTPAAAAAHWRSFYAGSEFVEVLSDGLPSLRGVVERNVVSIGFSAVAGVERPMLLVVAALDNLVKGAAGQAVQNANLMFGLPEAEGLPR